MLNKLVIKRLLVLIFIVSTLKPILALNAHRKRDLRQRWIDVFCDKWLTMPTSTALIPL